MVPELDCCITIMTTACVNMDYSEHLCSRVIHPVQCPSSDLLISTRGIPYFCPIKLLGRNELRYKITINTYLIFNTQILVGNVILPPASHI